jgi:hypothetical protein
LYFSETQGALIHPSHATHNPSSPLMFLQLLYRNLKVICDRLDKLE